MSLVRDSAWQVRLCDLESFLELLEFCTACDARRVSETLAGLGKFPHPTLKRLVMDTFLSICRRFGSDGDGRELKAFADDMLSQGPGVKLHFLKGVAEKGLASLLPERLNVVVGSLAGDAQWRVRRGVVGLVNPLAALTGCERVREQLVRVCVSLTDDDAYPVRQAAAESLASKLISEEAAQLPAFVHEMGCSRSFRQRQATVEVLTALARGSAALRGECVRELARLGADACPAVAGLADRLMRGLEPR